MIFHKRPHPRLIQLREYDLHISCRSLQCTKHYKHHLRTHIQDLDTYLLIQRYSARRNRRTDCTQGMLQISIRGQRRKRRRNMARFLRKFQKLLYKAAQIDTRNTFVHRGKWKDIRQEGRRCFEKRESPSARNRREGSCPLRLPIPMRQLQWSCPLSLPNSPLADSLHKTGLSHRFQKSLLHLHTFQKKSGRNDHNWWRSW